MQKPTTYQNTRTDTVQNADGQQRSLAICGKVFVHTDPDGDADGRDQGECETHEPRCPAACEVEERDTGTQGETFEELVEDDDDEESTPAFTAA